MKTRTHRLFACLAAALCLGGSAAAAPAPAEIWVSPDGSDLNEGTRAAPMASIDLAQRKAREMRRLKDPAAEGGVDVILRGGVYRLIQPLLVRPEDSGTADSPTVFKAAPGERPVISGGVPVTGWAPLRETVAGLPEAARGNVWVAEAPRAGPRRVEFRDLWVDGRRADRARDAYGEEMNELLVWDRENREAWIPAPAGDWSGNPEPMEMVVHQMWAVAVMRVKTFEVRGDRARVTFHEPESRLQFEKPWPFVWMRGEGNDSPYYLTNSIRLLNRPGEWYQCPESGRVYYWPRDGEAMASAEVTAPYLETVVRVAGTTDRPVSHVHFRGLEFSHTTWMRPTHYGHVPLQAGFFMYDAYNLSPRGTPESDTLCNQAWVGRKPAAVTVEGLHDSSFERCFFTHHASAGLDLVRATRGNRVEGNVFRDIGGNGLVIGAFQEEGVETHLPYDPADPRELCQNERIANNLFVDVANVDWGCVAVIAGFVRGVTIEHNEIRDVSYTGISLGWGWVIAESAMRDNHVRNNHIHRYGMHMYDTAGIYTLSSQPDSSITGNSVHSILRPSYVHDPHHWSYIYLDEGSDHFLVEDNWTEGVKFSTNRTGENNVWRRTGPHAPREVRENAGLQRRFRDLLESL